MFRRSLIYILYSIYPSEPMRFEHVTFSSCLYCDKPSSILYASKALMNFEWLQKKFPGCKIVLYYDHTMSEQFLEATQTLGGVTLKFVKHGGIGDKMVLSRLLELDRQSNDWVVVTDIHDEYDNQENFINSVNALHGSTTSILRIMHWKEYKKVIPDCAFIALSHKAKMKTTIESHIKSHRNYHYGQDEKLVLTWIKSTFGNQWKTSPTISLIENDQEWDMDLGGALVLDPTPPSDASSYADEIIDWSDVLNKKLSIQTNFKL
jgi:hypothetical protein